MKLALTMPKLIDLEIIISPYQKNKEGDKMKIRFISENKLDDSWESVSPNIEDVFLYVYKDEVIKEG